MRIKENAGTPSAGTSEVQTVTLSNFGACTLTLTFAGASTSHTFVGNEANGSIDTTVQAMLDALPTIGTSNSVVSTSGTTNRAIEITFAANLGRLNVDVFTATASGGSAVNATLTTALTGANNDLKFTAVTAGTGGNSITVSYVDPSANDQALSVSVLGTAITVNLATGGAGAITSTGATIKAALIASGGAAALITPAFATSNDGSGVVTAMSATALSGGLAAPIASVATNTPGVDATGRGAIGKGGLLTDTTNGVLYINTGTVLAPTWTKVGTQS